MASILPTTSMELMRRPPQTLWTTLYVAGDLCVKADGTFYTWIQAGVTSCASGETHVATNLGTNKTEWISYIPELDRNLEKYIAQGYDVLSVQFRIGCFNTTRHSRATLVATTMCSSWLAKLATMFPSRAPYCCLVSQWLAWDSPVAGRFEDFLGKAKRRQLSPLLF